KKHQHSDSNLKSIMEDLQKNGESDGQLDNKLSSRHALIQGLLYKVDVHRHSLTHEEITSRDTSFQQLLDTVPFNITVEGKQGALKNFHQMVLLSNSGLMREYLRQGRILPDQNRQQQVDWPEFDQEILDLVWEFMYRNSVSGVASRLEDFRGALDYLKITHYVTEKKKQ
ncbi:unnamed protein product, partial [Allacma fusca]